MEFLCSSCGACCRSLGKEVGEEVGLPVNEDGSCAHLIGTLCSIYDDRPDVCRVDKLFENHFKDSGISRKELYILNTRACHVLIDQLGLSEDYKIDIEEYDD
jgi:hypothetical protein